MNVYVDTLPNCITTMRVEVPPDRVAQVRDAVTRDYTRQVRIPGYRPGKAPLPVVQSRFKKEIGEELKRRLLSQSCREAITAKKLRVLSLAEVDDVEIANDDSMSFTATLVTAPEFELPDYRHIPLKDYPTEVTDEEIDRAVENLRDQSADFVDVPERPLAMEDYAVLDYTGTLEGKAIDEVVPGAAKPLNAGNDFWLRMTPEAFFPNFTAQLVGMAVGETRDISVQVPAEFGVEQLAGKTLDYRVTLKAIKAKQLPAFDDEFAARTVPGKTAGELREMIAAELRTQKRQDADRMRKNDIMNFLLSNVECELPQDYVHSETRRILNDLVRQNQERGVSDEVLKENQKDLVGAAGQSARDRLKGTFILMRIAEQEKITVSPRELEERIALLSARYGMPREKIKKELESRGAMDQVREEILTGKVLEFLSAPESAAKVEEPAVSEA
jgi:trigger factor